MNNVLRILKSKGFNTNESLNIIKRINKHISFCMDNNQNFDETVYYVNQDFTFCTENLIIEIGLLDEKIEQYYLTRC